ncbi:MAG TPA: hypothetical protein PKJ41_06920 [Bryobacteraceae bacterium]|nr:hypothetical protein [Bryobacteraceae bacterium]
MFPDAKPPRRLVSSWKGIAAHFGVTVRTVQLWEEERGLPVHRMPGVKGRVYAYEDELEAWAGRAEDCIAEPIVPDPEPRQSRTSRRGHWVAASILLVTIVAGSAFLLRPKPVPSSFVIEGRTLVVKNSEGSPIWRHEFTNKLFAQWEGREGGDPFRETRPWIGDLDGDGKREVLFTRTADPKLVSDSELFCFESDGRIRWRYKPGRLVSTQKEQFPPPYFVRMVLVLEDNTGKPPLLLAVGTHSIYYPSHIAALSPQGKVLREYWHSGHINGATAADLDADGKLELYLLANHNPTKTSSLVALDPMDFSGASRESHLDYQLLGVGEPRELGRIIFPSSEYTRRLFDVSNPLGINLQSGRLFLSLTQRSAAPGDSGVPSVFYQIGPKLTLLGVEYAWNFRFAYEEAVRQGKIKPYDLDADLERMKQFTVVTPWRNALPKNPSPSGSD